MSSDRARRFTAGTLPTIHQLRSALRAGRLISDAGTPVLTAHESYLRVPWGGIYRAADLIIGEEVLIAAGLLRESDEILYPEASLAELTQTSDEDGCEAVLVRLLQERRPLWLVAATSDGALVEDLIPDEQRRVLDGVLDPQAREDLLLSLGRRFSDQERQETGALAEEFVVDCCREGLRDAGASDLAERVRRVSQTSDQLGYDITAPRLDRSTRRLEVKGTRSGGENVVFYLSRNEASRALTDNRWALVACFVMSGDAVELLGWVEGCELESHLPADPSGSESRWETARISLPKAVFHRGLPPI